MPFGEHYCPALQMREVGRSITQALLQLPGEQAHTGEILPHILYSQFSQLCSPFAVVVKEPPVWWIFTWSRAQRMPCGSVTGKRLQR